MLQRKLNSTSSFPGLNEFIDSLQVQVTTRKSYATELESILRKAQEVGISHPAEFNARTLETLQRHR